MEKSKEVAVPERVLDQLMQSAGVSTYHPDGSQQQKLYAFARAAIEEAMFRLPRAEPQKDAEPVAWMWDEYPGPQFMPDGMVRRFATHVSTGPKDRQVPLYTRPKAATVPDFRGYAALGTGQYLLNACPATDDLPPELVIQVATDEQKVGRVVGDLKDCEPGTMIQPETIAVRLAFFSVAGLDALEQQLRILREESFPGSAKSEAPKKSHRWDGDGERCLDCGDKDWFAGPHCSAQSEGEQK